MRSKRSSRKCCSDVGRRKVEETRRFAEGLRHAARIKDNLELDYRGHWRGQGHYLIDIEHFIAPCPSRSNFQSNHSSCSNFRIS